MGCRVSKVKNNYLRTQNISFMAQMPLKSSLSIFKSSSVEKSKIIVVVVRSVISVNYLYFFSNAHHFFILFSGLIF